MSSPSSPPLNLDVAYRPAEAWIARAGLALAMLGPCFVLASHPLPTRAVVSTVLGVIVALGLLKCGWVGASANRIVSLAWLSDGCWLVRHRDGRTRECELCLNSRVLAGWVWLRLRPVDAPRRVYSLLLLTPRVAPDSLRRLIVRLRLDVPRSGAAVAPAR